MREAKPEDVKKLADASRRLMQTVGFELAQSYRECGFDKLGVPVSSYVAHTMAALAHPESVLDLAITVKEALKS